MSILDKFTYFVNNDEYLNIENFIYIINQDQISILIKHAKFIKNDKMYEFLINFLNDEKLVKNYYDYKKTIDDSDNKFLEDDPGYQLDDKIKSMKYYKSAIITRVAIQYQYSKFFFEKKLNDHVTSIIFSFLLPKNTMNNIIHRRIFEKNDKLTLIDEYGQHFMLNMKRDSYVLKTINGDKIPKKYRLLDCFQDNEFGIDYSDTEPKILNVDKYIDGWIIQRYIPVYRKKTTSYINDTYKHRYIKLLYENKVLMCMKEIPKGLEIYILFSSDKYKCQLMNANVN